ncbi:MAG: Fur family transcriptional regulator [Dehalococcoidia bacterium]|jgi:Fur family ferric uptake transcriptional regulator
MSCITTFKKKGLKLTPQRKLILDIIHETGEHLSAETIISRVQEKMPGVHKSTIYRTLDLLEEHGCVYKSPLGNQFIYHHPEEGHHHHLVCTQCGKSIDCDDGVFAPAEKTIGEEYGFRVDFKHIVMSGLCEECRRKTGSR